MNKKEVIAFYKRELKEIETSLSVLQQSIEVTTRRKFTLTEALEKLGSKVPPKKSVLTEKQKIEILASLTK